MPRLSLLKSLKLLIFATMLLSNNAFAQEESLSQVLQFPATGNWNGFLNHLNIIECSNLNNSEVILSLSLKNNIAEEIGTREIRIPALQTAHTILNDFDIADTFGTYLLNMKSSPNSLSERIICYTVIYRFAAEESARQLDYAFALPLQNPTTGTSAGLFNSIDPDAENSPTQNWLSIINTGSSEFSAQIETYAQSGEKGETISVNALAAGQRIDLPFGHNDSDTKGQSVGLYRIIPSSGSAPYQAFLTRYKQRNGEYVFAFPLDALSGSCNTQQISLSTMNPANNWIEIANLAAKTATITLEIRDNSGSIIHTEEQRLPAFSQQHTNINQFIGDNATGTARVICKEAISDSILVQSMFYGRRSENEQQIDWAYGVQAEGRLMGAQSELALPVNTFLSSFNWLRQNNSSAGTHSGMLGEIVVDSSEPLGYRQQDSELQLAPRQSLDYFLNGTVFPADSIGAAILDSELIGSNLHASALRVFPHDEGGIGTILHIPASIISQAKVKLTQVASGLIAPVYITSAGDNSGRLFVVEKGGMIKILDQGAILPTPFLDLSALLPAGSATTEQGVQNIVFHPNYQANGRFFVLHNEASGASRLAEYAVSADANIADAASERVLLTVPKTETFHQGGQLLFGTDGYLYISLGDGGPQEDTEGNGQNLGNLLGTVLRIDVDGAVPYAIPADNPYVGNPAARDEIWAHGFRNPWRFSFDPLSNRMFLGDVGQYSVEEVDIVTKGGNYGWNTMEGSTCFNPASECDTEGLELPIHDYSRKDGGSVIGGFVYRGESIPALQGAYIFGDFNTAKIWILREGLDGTWERSLLFQTSFLLSSFGIDQNGEIYVIDILGGIYRMEAV